MLVVVEGLGIVKNERKSNREKIKQSVSTTYEAGTTKMGLISLNLNSVVTLF